VKTIKTLLVLIFLVLLINCGTAEKKVNLAQEQIKLPTIQCEICKSTIEKAISELDGVKSITVNPEEKIGFIEYDKNIMKISDIEKAISDLGYQANDLAANPEAYTKLPGCCKIPE
jgi:copper chaperone CopZ